MSIVSLINQVPNKCLKRELKFSEHIPTGYFLNICINRGLMCIRGMLCIGLKKKGKNLFIGKNVNLNCRNRLDIGNGVSIHDNIVIDALSTEGIQLGNNVSIGRGCEIRGSGSLVAVGKGFRMGNGSTMGGNCFIGAAGEVVIGENCLQVSLGKPQFQRSGYSYLSSRSNKQRH